jgi:hypothetical protein
VFQLCKWAVLVKLRMVEEGDYSCVGLGPSFPTVSKRLPTVYNRILLIV